MAVAESIDAAIPTATILLAKTYVDERLAEADRRYSERDKAAAEAIRIAVTAADKRLDTMNEFRETLSDQASTFIPRAETVALVEKMTAQYRAETAPVIAKVEQLRATNWPLFGVFGSSAAGIVAAIWVIIGLKIDATNSPVHISIEAARINVQQIDNRLHAAEQAIAESTQADGLSRADRAQLNDRVNAVEIQAHQSATDERGNALNFGGKLTEIETQFRQLSNVENLTADYTQQMLAIVYAETFPGKVLPATPFRPQLYR